jgi:hypothetical protein
MPRYRATIKIRLRGMDPDNREAFWTEYRQRTYPREGPPEGPEEGYISYHENAIRSRFAPRLQEMLAPSFDQVAVIFRSIEYGSLNIGLDLIVGTMAAAGLTTDDLLDLLMQFTPEALEQSLRAPPVMSTMVSVDGEIRTATDQTAPGGEATAIPASDPQAPAAPATERTATPATETVQPWSRLSRAWWIANTSLVVTALVLVGAALLVFLNAQDDKRV